MRPAVSVVIIAVDVPDKWMWLASLLLLKPLLLLTFHFHRIWVILLLYVSPNVQILSYVAVGPAVAVVLSAAEVIP